MNGCFDLQEGSLFLSVLQHDMNGWLNCSYTLELVIVRSVENLYTSFHILRTDQELWLSDKSTVCQG